MAVIAVWKCDRDNSMFADKKEAEEHDRMLELADNIRALIEGNVSGISEEHSEAIGLLLAQHRDVLAKACKGKPGVLLELGNNDSELVDPQYTSPKSVIPLNASA